MSYERPSGPMPSGLGLNQVWRADGVRSPGPDEAFSAIACRDDRRISLESFTLAVIAALTLAFVSGTQWYSNGPPLFGNATVKAVVERIIAVESGGEVLDETWLEMIRTYRRDLVEGRSEKEILELRRDPELTRAIITRLVKQNAAMLKKRGLPVTPGTLYLTHFAGPAGAVAVLSVSDNADAASLMASADATGRTTREKLVYANPFLKEFKVGDLKNWANRKMDGS